MDLFILVLALGFVIIGCGLFAYSLVKVFIYKVPMIPTPPDVISEMLGLVDGVPQSICDLGCGTGPILFAARKRFPCAKLVGYEVLLPAVLYGRGKSFLLRANIQFKSRDFFTVNMKEPDVIVCYLWPSIMDRFREEIWPQLSPGTQVISHGFKIKDLTPLSVVNIKKGKIWKYVKN